MRRLIPILRCKCRRCAASRRRALGALTISFAIILSWKLLRADHQSASSRTGGAGTVVSSANFYDYPAIDRSPGPGDLSTSNLIPNSDPSAVKLRTPNPGLSPERFNAALAAGLIDPSRLKFLDPIVPSLNSSADHSKTLTGAGADAENSSSGTRIGTSSMAVPAASPTLAAVAKSTTPTEALPTLARTLNRILHTDAVRSAESEPKGELFASPWGGTPPKAPISTKKPFPVGFVAKARTETFEGSSAQRKMSRNDPPPDRTKAEEPTDRRTDDRDSKSQDLTENLQQFASDFVRADQTNDIAEQERFFAESVHFYREGDLSLASVAAATRRYHREQQTRRCEAAGPAIATGPVNGGFFVIEQPVRWTQSQGSKVVQGRSVLRLRVVPINHGSWKITSIEEVKK